MSRDGYWVERLSVDGNTPEIVEHIIVAFEPLVVSLAARYWQPILGAEKDDLEQVARVGLLNACATFDRSKGAFPTHAMWCIREQLTSYVGKLENPVKLPLYLMRKLPRLRPLANRLAQTLQREPTVQDLSEAMQLSVEVTEQLIAYDYATTSFDDPSIFSHYAGHMNDREHTLHEVLPAPGLSPEEQLIVKESGE